MKYIFALTLLLFSTTSFAQAPNAQEAAAPASGTEFGFHTGPLLPNQIEGMSEILPVWGLLFATPFRRGLLEFDLANSRGEGVVYYNAAVSYRYDVTLDEVTGMLSAGLDLHQWSSPPDDTTRMVGGGHVGGGLLVPMGDSMWFRTEMKFNMNPGTSLYIGFGLVLRFPEEAGGAE